MSLWSDPRGDGRLAPRFRGPPAGAAIGRLKDHTRERFGLSENDTVVVTEGIPAFPGAPPVETLVAFWIGDGAPYHFKVFKPVAEVTEDDIPPAWMKDALAGVPGIACACC